MKRALLALLVLAGCQSPEYEQTELLPPAKVRAAPTFAQLRRCLNEVFSRRMPASVMQDLHARLTGHGEAWFQVPVASSYGTYYHHHFVAYLSGPQVLVVGRLKKDESIDQLGAWYVADPVPVPVTKDAPKPAPKQCPKCGFKKLLPSYKACPGCNAPLR